MSTAFTRLKMAVHAPMPRASVSTALMVKPGAPAQCAQAIAQVLHGLFDPQQRALVAMCLFCLLHLVVGASRGQACFFRRHAAAFEVVGEEGEVRFDFERKVLF